MGFLPYFVIRYRSLLILYISSFIYILKGSVLNTLFIQALNRIGSSHMMTYIGCNLPISTQSPPRKIVTNHNKVSHSLDWKRARLVLSSLNLGYLSLLKYQLSFLSSLFWELLVNFVWMALFV